MVSLIIVGGFGAAIGVSQYYLFYVRAWGNMVGLDADLTTEICNFLSTEKEDITREKIVWLKWVILNHYSETGRCAEVYYYNELIAEMLSEYTCYHCGKRPIDENGKIYIWKSCGYILPFCDECKAKYPDEDYEKAVLDNDYAITQYEKNGVYRVNYIEKDGWLERTEPKLIKENNQ